MLTSISCGSSGWGIHGHPQVVVQGNSIYHSMHEHEIVCIVSRMFKAPGKHVTSPRNSPQPLISSQNAHSWSEHTLERGRVKMRMGSHPAQAQTCEWTESCN